MTLEECFLCRLHEGRKNIVLGVGDTKSPVVFIGEAPGRQEDERGLPFVGAAGNVLTMMMYNLGWSRKSVFITNLVRCRPPKNRKPRVDEIEACSIWLKGELGYIKPKYIVPMGTFATQFIFKRFDIGWRNMSEVHGKIIPCTAEWGDTIIFPLYHPAAALYNPSLADSMQDDLSVLHELVKTA